MTFSSLQFHEIMYGILEEGFEMARNKTLSALCILLFILATGLAGGLKGRMGKNTVKGSDLELSSKVWVKKPDGSMSCDQAVEGQKEGHSAEHATENGAALLKKEGIHVFEFKKTNDGQMRATVCGIPTGNEDSFLIPEKDLAKATALGFSRVSK